MTSRIQALAKGTMLLLVFGMVALAYAQPPDTVWTRTFGGPYLDRFFDVISTSDGGLVAVGQSYPDSLNQPSEMMVAKTDSMGNMEWSRYFWRSPLSVAYSVVEVEDGFLISGYVTVLGRIGNAALAKFSLNGDSLWARTYGGAGDDLVRAMIRSADGSVVMAGLTNSFGPNPYDIWLLVVGENGDSLWSRTYGQSGFEQAYALAQLPDGGFALAGETESDGHSPADMWLVRTNANGDSLWSRAYGGGGYDEAYGMTLTSDQGFLLVGYTGSFGQGWENVYLVKVDSLGNQQWQRTYGEALQDYASHVVQLPDGGFAIAASDNPEVNQASAWLLRTDSSGDTLWSRRWNRGHLNDIPALIHLPNESYVMAGHAGWDENNRRSGDAWLLKTAPDPVAANPRKVFLPSQIALSAYPNPFNSSTTLTLTLPHASVTTIEIVDVTGRRVRTLSDSWLLPGAHRLLMVAGSLASGSYFVRLITPDVQQTRRIVLIK